MMKKHLSLKNLLFALLTGMIACSLLSGCHGPQYKEDEKAELEKQGEALMQTWLDGHIKDGRVLTVEADINMIPSGPHYLTDYAAGTFEGGGRTRDYLINTKTEEVYLVHDGELLSDVCLDYAYEQLGLDSLRDDCRAYDTQAFMWLPDRGNSYEGTEDAGQGTWLPGELVLSLENANAADGTAMGAQIGLLESFVRSPDRRGPIGFGGSIRVPEEVDLEQYNMAYWVKQQEETGIVYQNLDLSDDFESISTYNSRASYDRYCFRKIEDPDIRIFMNDALWVEKNGKDGIEVVEKKEYSLSDLSFEKTEKGYLVTFPDYEHVFGFSIYADEGSEFLKHEYHSHEDREAYLSPGSKIGGDKYFEMDLYWKDTGRDGYLLTDQDGYRKMFFGGEELIPRD